MAVSANGNSTPQGSPPQPRILIVDDEPEACRLLSMVLAMEGFRSEIASEGYEALARLQQDPPDLVLLDVMLPGIDGLEICRMIRSDPRLKGVPVVLISAKSKPEDIDLGFAAGADAYLTKPLKVPEVIKTIQEVLSARDSDG